MMVMIVCDIVALFWLTSSSIILVDLTLRLHFVAHYRRRWSKGGTVKLQAVFPTQKETGGHVQVGILIGLSVLHYRTPNFLFMRSHTSVHVLAFFALSDMSEWLGELDLPACLLGTL